MQTLRNKLHISIIATVFVFLVIGLAQSVQAVPKGWGANGGGRLGTGISSSKEVTPVDIPAAEVFSALDGGSAHTVGLKPDGTVWAWGNNRYGQIGDGSASWSNRLSPVQVIGLSGVVKIAVSAYHSLALKSDGTVWAWGANWSGQLGDGTTVESNTPVQVAGLTDVIAISSVGYHSVALKADGTVWGWGEGSAGQLGDGTYTSRRLSPVQASGLSSVVAISAGYWHTMALKSDGTVWTWGSNQSGQIGIAGGYRKTPVQVTSLSSVIAIVAGVYHSMALLSDGTVWSWGWNYFGQVGTGGSADEHIPVEVLSGVTAIDAGAYTSFAIKSDGTLWAWGRNNKGQIGNGSFGADEPTPLQSSISGVSVIATGWDHMFAMDGVVSGSNQPPVPTAPDIITDEDISASTVVDPVDPDAGDTHSFSITTAPSWGVASVDASGNVSYTPGADLNGSDSLVVTVTDAAGDTGAVTIAVVVNAVNDAPAATSASITTDEDVTSTGVSPAVTDADMATNGDSHTFAIVTQPASGTASVVGNQLVYAPSLNSNGVDSFTFSATDTGGLGVIGTASVSVNAVNDAPVLSLSGSAAVTLEAGDPYTDAGATASDIEDDNATLSAAIVVSGSVDNMVLGSYTLTYNVTDSGGLSAAPVSRSITVVDTTAPVLTVPANVSIEANAVLSTVTLGTATATDIFGATVANDAPAAGFPLGTTTVTYTATDGNGLQTTGTQTVAVVDTTAPVLNVPGSVSIEANGVLSSLPLGTATATDIFGVTIANDAPAAGFSLGTTTVTYTATDGNGLQSTGTQTVTVVDTTAPVLTLPANVSVEANAVLSTVAIGSATATDIFAVTITSDAPATYALGTTVVTWTAADANGNATTGTQTVTVVDTTAPLQTVPANVSIEANAVLSTVAIGTATATDIFGVTVTNNAPATFPVGTTVVTWTATDGNGLITTGTQNVTVVDSTAPTVTARLIPQFIGHNDEEDEDGLKEGMFKVVFAATDIADPNLVVTAMLNGAVVTNGQIIKLERDDEIKVEMEHGVLEIKGMSFSLNVSATDASGNIGSAAAAFAFPHEHKDEHKKDKKHDKKDKKHDKDRD